MLGLSLPPSYLAGTPISEEAALLEKTCGGAAALLEHLKTKGLRSVELRKVYEDTAPSLVLAAVRRVWAAGLGITVHGTTPEAPEGGTLESLFPALNGFWDAFAEHQQHVMMTLHAYRARSGKVGALEAKMVELVQKVMADADRRKLPLKLALELNRAKNWVDPSYTYDGLLRMWREIDHPRVGFCWDVGHAYRNVTEQGLTLEPPQGFLEHTIHTHIHDLSHTGQTHWPLTRDVIPLEMFVSVLERIGYAGVYNLELSPIRFHQAEGVREGIDESIARLARVLDQA